MSDKEILEKLLEFAPFLSIQNMIKDIGRAVLYWISSVLMWIVEKVGGVLTEMVSVLGFYKSADMTGDGGILETFSAFQKFGIGITLLIIGAVLFLGKTEETRAVPLNALLMVVIVMLLPSIMSDGIKIVNSTVDAVSSEQAEFGFDSFKKNVTDVYVLADNGWTTTEPKNKNYLEDRNFFDVNEKITDAEDIDNGEPLLYEVVNSKSGSGKELQKFDSDGGTIAKWLMKQLFVKGYYRWSINWLPLIATLACLAFSLIISLVRCGRLGIELGFNYIWANIVAYFSIRNIKFLKTAVLELFSGFVLILSIFGMYAVFIAYNSWLGTQQLSVLAQIFGIIGGAWFIYDGPSIIQKTLGIDAGLSTAGSFVMGIGAMKAVKKAGEMTGKTVNGAANTAGFVKGLSEGMSSKEEPKNDEKAGLNSEMAKNTNEDLPEEENKNGSNNQQPDVQNQEDSNENSEELDQPQENEPGTSEAETEQEMSEDQLPQTPENQSEVELQEEPESRIEENLELSENDASLEQTEPYANDYENNMEDDHNNNSVDDFEGESSGSPHIEEQTPLTDEPESNNDQSNLSTIDNEVPINEPTATSLNSGDADTEQTVNEKDSAVKNNSETKNVKGNHTENKKPENDKDEEMPNPFSKKVNQMVHTPNYQKNTKNKVGNMVDGYNRNKEFGQEVNEWLKQRRNKREEQHPESVAPYLDRKRTKNKSE
ncbi:pLS20_p028 family conjugation system transmembrane protein [Enterococcus casseliflavus]|uniref:pLS20_p028 family conjugation system transmembrane protein n=1 Tax=Enterococcus casseliflavus TaxID=37734 RepID=UPI003DA4CFC6